MAEIHVQTKKHSPAGANWIWIVVVLLIAAAAVYYFMTRNQQTQTTTPPANTGAVQQPAPSGILLLEQGNRA